MPVDHDLVPEYLVLVNQHQRYKVNRARRILGQPSDDLIAYAKANGTNISIDAKAWDEFARDAGLSPVERERFCCYIVLKYNETDEQLQRLINM